jgi:hypothetical protein
MDDEADGCGDQIAGFESSMENVALNEPTWEELPCEHLIPKLGDSTGKISQEREILFASLRSTRGIVPDLGIRRIEFSNRTDVASLDRSEELRRDCVGLIGHGCVLIRFRGLADRALACAPQADVC